TQHLCSQRVFNTTHINCKYFIYLPLSNYFHYAGIYGSRPCGSVARCSIWHFLSQGIKKVGNSNHYPAQPRQGQRSPEGGPYTYLKTLYHLRKGPRQLDPDLS